MPFRDEMLGIGDLARLTGVPVRTIRFYCDEGVITSVRSAGGHRRFDRAAVERLALIRRLRGLGLGLSAIGAVLEGEATLAKAVADERAALDARLRELAWRRARLRAVEEAASAAEQAAGLAPAEDAEAARERLVAARLELLAAVEDAEAAHARLVAFWRLQMVLPVTDELFGSFAAMAAPPPPADPAPAQVVAYAELVALAGDRSLARDLRARARENARAITDENELMHGVGEAVALAQPLVAAGEPPGPGPELDRFVAAHAGVRRRADTPDFRRELLGVLAADHDPRMRRYWRLVGEVSGTSTTVGHTITWLGDALAHSLAVPERGPGKKGPGKTGTGKTG
ncbi:MerR family transcriptional regulator [Nonomuraea sp. NPDC049309]|uniref:MerR family transcriptional regulator n=1 Tax=Nonomuraea sp. NPDC049309 TaxID=3364350 RepID=UPI00371A1DFA